MAGAVDYVMDSASKGYALTSRSTRPLLTDLLKVHLLSTAIGILGLLLMLGVLVMGGGNELAAYLQAIAGGAQPGSISVSPSLMGVVAIAAIVWLASALLSAAARAVAYNAVSNADAGGQTRLFEQFRKNCLPVMKLSLVIWIGFLVLGTPLLLSLATAGTEPGVGACILTALSGVALVLFAFFNQFSVLELVLKGKGPVESLKSSFYLAKANAFAVLLLDVIIVIAALASELGTSIVQKALDPLGGAFASAGSAGLLAGYAAFFVLLIVFSAIVEAVVDTVVLPVVYYFWRNAAQQAAKAR